MSLFSVVTVDGAGTIPAEIGYLQYENNAWKLYHLADDGSKSYAYEVEIRSHGNKLAWYLRESNSEELMVWERKQDSELQDQTLEEEISRTSEIARRRSIALEMANLRSLSKELTNMAKTQHEIGMTFGRNIRVE